ncbi:hydroxymethylglutaryl-CoA lyase [Dyadobacter arcticus]|uniref:Hydroxymethylglutaryl-CoA lyase n=1 Tax=Dyadobacter arcticus TaxID=1078754 RepID=A0ABX0UIZ8_9BACT|nr:hydroxymethylglutaryl-CoA lyase [Dyadobacter arcticus]NIJ51365.1 hydroxymethylglutaryl-CoA lyase [Dyadobacter arcticus]
MKIIECPRDAWQGFHPFIPTEKKIAYLNQLLKVGFDTIDFGSFVSPKAMPQVSDTAALLDGLQISETSAGLLAIVANERGAAEACQHAAINSLGYPFSISETFQLRNTNATIAESLDRVRCIADLCGTNRKELVIYISMGFGNPYGDPWNPEIVMEWVDRLSMLDIRTFALSDTVGVAKTVDIDQLFTQLTPAYPQLEFGAHFHTSYESWRFKIDAAYQAGCRRFDGALFGYGGCPMAQDDLIGNMPTEKLIDFAAEKEEPLAINQVELQKARLMFLELVEK